MQTAESSSWLSAMNRSPVLALMTPLSQIATVELGATIREARNTATRGPFDQLAAVDSSGSREIVGLVCVERLEGLADTDIVDPYIDRDLASISVPVTAALAEVLKRLAEHPTLLVGDSEQTVGLIHRSDLNKQPMRVALYAEIVELEMGLSELVESLAGFDRWITCLRETSQIQVLGRREVDRRNNNEISPLQYLNLSDLVDIVRKLEVYTAVGCSSKSQWDKAAGGLVHLRNCVMHPVRYLVSDTESVGQLLAREQRLQELLHALRMHQSTSSADL